MKHSQVAGGLNFSYLNQDEVSVPWLEGIIKQKDFEIQRLQNKIKELEEEKE